jgi:hypothetical protein
MDQSAHSVLILQSTTQLTDASSQCLVGAMAMTPHLIQNILAPDDLAGLFRKDQQNLHRLGMNMSNTPWAGDVPLKRSDLPIVNLKATLKAWNHGVYPRLKMV